MKDLLQQTNQTMPISKLSLLSIALTVILASITHAYEFGHHAFIAGFILITLISTFNIIYQRTRNKVSHVFYVLLNTLVIIGFGLFNGFWNHAFKVFLYYLHNEYLPPILAKLFMTPQIGSFFFEGVGILTFVMSVFAAYYGYKFMKEGC